MWNKDILNAPWLLLVKIVLLLQIYLFIKKLKDLGYGVLLISPGYINLENQEYGFIGGATGNLSIEKNAFFLEY